MMTRWARAREGRRARRARRRALMAGNRVRAIFVAEDDVALLGDVFFIQEKKNTLCFLFPVSVDVEETVTTVCVNGSRCARPKRVGAQEHDTDWRDRFSLFVGDSNNNAIILHFIFTPSRRSSRASSLPPKPRYSRPIVVSKLASGRWTPTARPSNPGKSNKCLGPKKPARA